MLMVSSSWAAEKSYPSVPELSSTVSTLKLCIRIFGCHWRLCPPVRGGGHGQASCPWHPRPSSTHNFKIDTVVACAMRTERNERQGNRAHSARYVDCVPMPCGPI